MALEDSKAAADAALAEVKTRAEAKDAESKAFEARALDAEKKLQDALDSEASLTTWFEQHTAKANAILAPAPGPPQS